MTHRSRRPYLIRAIYQWATDNPLTPHVLVAADYPGVVVPQSYVQDGRITLNISPAAVANLEFLEEMMWFSARFAGRAFEVQVPYGAVLAIFARENGEGVVFGDVEPPEGHGEAKPQPESDPPPSPGGDKPRPDRSHLRVVK